MKKYVALILALILCLFSTSALAAGKLNVVQENYYTIPGMFTYGYAYAKVENKGDKPISVNAGVLEIYDKDGAAITSSDYLSAHCANLQPGEYTYVKMYSEIKGADNGVVADDYMLTVTGKSDSSYVFDRLPCTANLELNVEDGWWTYNYMYATVTNDTTEPIYDINVVFALLDDAGNILYIANNQVYNIALAPGSSMIFREDISSSFIEYYNTYGITPTKIDAIAYTQEYSY